MQMDVSELQHRLFLEFLARNNAYIEMIIR